MKYNDIEVDSYVHRDVMIPNVLDEALADEASRRNVSPASIINEMLYARYKPQTIMVNGKPRMVCQHSFSYEDVVKLAGHDPSRILSVVFSYKRLCQDAFAVENVSGILSPGHFISTLGSDIRFEVYDTSNA